MEKNERLIYYFLEHDITKGMSKYLIIKNFINIENLLRIKEIIKENGWPKISEVGIQASRAAFLVIQHSDDETRNNYLPIFKDIVSKGEGEKALLATLIDRVKISNGEKQIYGTQVTGFKKGKVFFEYDKLIDPKNVNRRRAEMDLQLIEQYLKN